MMRWHCICLCCLVQFSAACPAAPAQAEDAKSLAAILDAWKTRQAEVHSISCKITGSEFHPKGRWNISFNSPQGKKLLAEKGGHIPPVDATYPLNAAFLLNFDNNWARKEHQMWILHGDTGEFAPKHTTYLYDGARIRWSEPREKNTSDVYTPSKAQPDLWLQGDYLADAFFAWEDSPLFWGCGIVQVISPLKMRQAFDPTLFHFHGRGEIHGRKCTILRTRLPANPHAFIEYWVDAQRDASILRCSFFSDDELDSRYEVEHEIQNGRWFPKKWTWTSYGWRESPQGLIFVARKSFQMQVDEVVINPATDRADFDVTFKPGMVVRDVENDTRGVIGNDGKTLLPLSEIDKLDKLGNAVRRRIVLSITAVFSLLLAVVLIWRKRRLRKLSS